jgi:hypothetical protein
MLDMEARLKPLRAKAFAVLGIGLVLTSPWLGYSITIFAVCLAIAGAASFAFAEKKARAAVYPEVWIFSSWLVSLGIIATLAIATGGVNGPTLSWFVVPVSTLSARFPLRAVVIGLVIALAVLAGVALVNDPQTTFENPPLLIAPAFLMIAVAVLSLAGMRSDVQHRASAFVDPLTGCLNRAALQNRLQELTQQSAVSRQAIGLIVGDIDHFKLINDSYGSGLENSGDHRGLYRHGVPRRPGGHGCISRAAAGRRGERARVSRHPARGVTALAGTPRRTVPRPGGLTGARDRRRLGDY